MDRYNRMLFYLVFSSIYFVTNNCYSQDSTDWQTAFDTLKPISQSKTRDVFLKPYIDSLNNYRNGDLPVFLSDYRFDSRYLVYWNSLHSPISLRKIIFDAIDNRMILEKIIKLKDEKFKKAENINNAKNEYNIIIPFAKFSNMELAKFRLEELKQEMNNDTILIKRND